MSRRTERISAELQSEIARILREEISDPRIGLVSITRVDVAPDLSHAVVFYSAIDLAADDEVALRALDDGLHSAATYVRRQAARVLPLRRMPELRFRYDPSLALGTRTLALLRELETDRRAGGDAAAPEGAAAEQGGGDGEKA